MVERLGAVRPPPYTFPPPGDHIKAAIKAFATGEADQSQQLVLRRWMIMELCETYKVPYFQGSSRDTDFALGKQWVGLTLESLSGPKAA